MVVKEIVMNKKDKNIDYNNVFETPEGYFEEMEIEVMSKIALKSSKSKTKTRVIQLTSWVSVAASIVFCVIYITQPKQEIDLPMADLNEINKDDLEEYLIINKTPVAEIITIDANKKINLNPSTHKLSKSEIEKYLEENNSNYGL